jgi:hypothetical protein
LLPLAVCVAAQGAHAEVGLPARTRAALLVHSARLRAQPTADRALGLSILQGAFSAPAALGNRAERFTLLLLQRSRGTSFCAVTAGRGDLRQLFARMHGSSAGSASGHELYAPRYGSWHMSLVDGGEIAEGSLQGLRLALATTDDSAQASHATLQHTLRQQPDTGAVATLLYLAPSEGANLVRIIRDLDTIWRDLALIVAPYETALGMLGKMRGGRADLREKGEHLYARIILVAMNRGAAKRSHLALRTGRMLAPLASQAAIRSGSMTRAEAEVLGEVLETMQTRVEADRIHIELRIPSSVVPAAE